MKITSVYVERSFKIKDYEMRKVGFTAELSETARALNPALQEIINQLTDHHGFYSDDLYKYWLLTDQQDKTKINGVGRRGYTNEW